MTPDEVLRECRALRQAMRRFPNRRAWLEHSAAPAQVARLQALLQQVRTYEPEDAGAIASAATNGPLRYVHWNILHGCSGEQILTALQTDPALQQADLISLNEVDVGMQRSGNIDVATQLAAPLGMHSAWCALFLELYGGQGPSASAATSPDAAPSSSTSSSEDREGLFGLALLSRYPLANPRRILLETPEDFLFDREGKVGAFVGLQVEVRHPLRPFHVVVTHLDVHGTPARRNRQMSALLDATPPGPLVLSGDLNTTTFARGNLLRSVRAFATLALTPAAALQQRLWRPDLPAGAAPESLFVTLRKAGLTWESFNDGRATLDLLLKDIQEVQRLPKFWRTLGRGMLQHVERRSSHRLDWIATRGFESDPDSPPTTSAQWMRGAAPASDHAPIACTLRWPSS